MKRILLLLLTIISSVAVAQNVSYTSLYDAAAFGAKTIVTTLPVGSTAGGGTVSANGAGSYSIPIGIPPGTNGVVPAVSLEYSSQAGPGIAGMGWNLSGLSTISRVPGNTYFDGQASQVTLTTGDRFALDGTRLLLTDGTNGVNGSKYATEVETFAVVTARGVAGNGPKFFEVMTKDGVKMEFGKNADARFTDQANSTVMFWRLNRIVQPDSNYVEFVYDNTDRDSRISEIRYTGNSATGQATYNKIAFAYKVRQDAANNFADIRTLYEAGSTIVSKYLLDKITITADGQTFKSYQLAYGHDKINSYLKSITESGSDNSTLNPTIFKYGDTPTELTEGSTSISGANIQAITGDFDGDGKREVLSAHKSSTEEGIDFFDSFTVYKSNGTGYTAIATKPLPVRYTVINKIDIPNARSFIPGDFTGDGNDDVLTLKISNTGTYQRLDSVTIYESVNGGTSFTQHRRQIQPNYFRIPSSKQFFFPGDFDGDGISEYLSILGNTNGLYDAFLCTNYLVGGACGAVTISGTTTMPSNNWQNASRITALDLNGDGRTDLMVEMAGNYEVFTFQGTTATRIANGALPTAYDRNFIGDFNGDGKTDILFTETNYNTMIKAISTGTGFVYTPFPLIKTWPDAVPPQLNYQFDELAIGDFNGDGRSDVHYSWDRNVLFPNQAGTGNDIHTYFGKDIYYSQGDSFRYKQLSFTHQIYTGYGRTAASSVTFTKDIPVDLNGDGKTDLVTTGESLLSYTLFNKDGRENLLHKVSNGVNHVTEWNYKSLVEGGTFYSKGSVASAYPVNVIQPAALLVSDLKTGDGIGGTTTSQYSYESARLHRSGKGFMGFGKFTSSNLATGLKTVSESEFNTTYFAAAPQKTSLYMSSGNTLVSETTFTNAFVQPGAKRFWIKTTGVSENRALEGATVTTSNVYDDANGNVTSTTVTSSTEVVATTAVFGAYPGSIPNKPTSITTTRTRSGQPAFSTITTYGYNAKGQTTTKTDFSGKAKAVTSTFSYNGLGNQTGISTSASGITTRSESLTFDDKGRYVQKTTNELSQESSAVFDLKWGNPTSVTSLDGLITTHTYDAFGRVKTTTINGDYTVTSTLAWDVLGNRAWKETTSYSQAGRAPSTEWFDQLGRSVRVQSQSFEDQLIEANVVFDSKGNVYSKEQPHKSTESFITTINSYDAFNRLSSANNGALGNTTYGYSYSAGNTTVTVTTPAGTTSKTTDLSGKLVSATDNGGILSYTYYSHGGLKEVKNGTVTATLNEYDEYGRQTKLTDANAGAIEYLYNAIGELTWQKNAKGEEYIMAYDLTGRLTTRTGPEGTTSSEYYTDNSSGNSKGKIKKVTGFASNNNTVYEYNNRGQLFKQKETVDNVLHETVYTYNVYGDLVLTTYPSGLQITQSYTANGYLNNITGAGTTLYTTTGMNGQGQVTGYSKGNGKSSLITYANGFATAFTTATVQDYQLVWDYQKGNLTSRKDARSAVNKIENFVYDGLDRLTSATIGSTSFTATYAANGNISTKTDVGTYAYHPSKLNATTGVVNPAGVIPSQQQDITYTGFNQPATVSENNYLLTYTYGAGYNRIKSELKLSGATQYTRYYFDAGFEKDVVGSTTRYLQYITGPSGLVAIIESNGGTHTTHYTYTDHLGSILTVTNSGGTIEAEQSFDAWGRRRNPTTWALLAPTTTTGLPTWLIRGFTGHEHLDQFGLINMNGRLYDPVLGRMLSSDNYVQEPGFTQSYNRYTYAFNNPLKYTDPNGQIAFWDNVIAGAVMGVYNVVTNFKAAVANPWKGLGFFGVGFASGVLAANGQIAASGAVLGAGNAALGGGTAQEILRDAALGAVTSTAGSALGNTVSPLVSKAVGEIGSPILKNIAVEMISGVVVGSAFGAIGAGITGGDILSGIGNGAFLGLGAGVASGTAKGLIYSRQYGVNPWTGKIPSAYATTYFYESHNSYTLSLPGGGPTVTASGGGKGFQSFTSFKREFGSAGTGKAWHHIVEQTPANLISFGEYKIHNTNNLIKLDHGAGSIHAKVSGYYSQKLPFTNGQTVRSWLSAKSYQEQYDFGIQVLKNFGWTP